MRLLARLAFSVGVLADIYLALARPSGLPEVDVWDKYLHGAVYCLLGVAALVGFGRRLSSVSICALVFLLGVLLEFVQAVLPYRSFSIGDMVANGVGVGIGALVVCLFERYLSGEKR